MSAKRGDRIYPGKAKPLNKRDYEMRYYCGGQGGGTCNLPAGVSRYTWHVDNDPEAVVNRYLSLQDTGQFQVWEDGGQTPTGFDDPACRSAGDGVPIYVGVSIDGNPTDAEIIAQGVLTGLGIPTLLEFDEKVLPQPTDPGYEGRTYVTIYWGSSTHVILNGSLSFGLPYRTEANLSNVEM